MENPRKQTYSYRSEKCPKIAEESPWEWWNTFRTLCDYTGKIGVALIVSADLPESDEVLFTH